MDKQTSLAKSGNDLLSRKWLLALLLWILTNPLPLLAQSDSLNQQINTGKDPVGTASPSVEGGRKSKALSIRYNVITQYTIQSTPHLPELSASSAEVRRLNEFELKLRVPLILKPRNKLILGFTYKLEEYNFKDPESLDSDIDTNLEDKNLHVLAMDLNLLTSLNDRNYFLGRVRASLNGDYATNDFPITHYTKFMLTAAYGWKFNPQHALAVGLSFNYTLGRPSIYPIVIWNKTINQKWGFESILPARFMLRYGLSPRSILLLGYEIDGNSYHLTVNQPPLSGFPALELRRSDLLTKITLEQELYDFLWFSIDTGYRYNINFDLAKDNSFNNEPIVSNEVSGSLFFNISLFIVPPKKLATKYLKDADIN
ncbi:MAG: hypothetical protein DHS20C17_35080 [Cyclobacteriaceae bacterium]|nr:MAG: hypothetical protein DHS20C17_35080 [Cyclobacteriaceae bacterium]